MTITLDTENKIRKLLISINNPLLFSKNYLEQEGVTAFATYKDTIESLQTATELTELFQTEDKHSSTKFKQTKLF